MVALAMGDIMTDSFSLVWILGMNCALETLVSQAHGAGQLGLSGAVYFRGWAVNTATALPAVFILPFSNPILQFLGQDPSVAEQAQIYALLTIPKAYLMGMYDLTKLYLGCFESTVPSMVIQIIACLMHIFWLQFLVIECEWGLSGIAIASSITALTMFLMTLAYARFIHAETRESFRLAKAYSIWDSWSVYLKLGVPGAACWALEVWSFRGM